MEKLRPSNAWSTLLFYIVTFKWIRNLHPKTFYSWDSTSTLRTTGTSWLDGLRGVAALQVFFFHFVPEYTPWLRTYGSSEEDHYIWQLPIFRAIWAAGSSAVCVFFVISGYAITLKSMTLLRRGNHEELYKGLVSSVIRRGFRLFLPVFMVSVPSFILYRIFDLTKSGLVYEPEIKDSTILQFYHWFEQSDSLVNPYMYPEDPGSLHRYAYVPTSWTIPLEYQGSMWTYIMVLVVSRIDTFKVRTIVTVLMSVYALHRGCWWVSCFYNGMVMADFVLEQKHRERNAGFRQTPSKARQMGIFVSLCGMLGFGLYLSGMPLPKNLYDFNPKPKVGYEWLYVLLPPSKWVMLEDSARFWWYWSGTLTFISISQLPRVRSIFETRFCQWLGKMSFSLYLVHPIVLALLKGPLDSLKEGVSPHNKFYQFLVAFPITAFCAFTVSALCERHIDVPSVQMARTFEKWLTLERERKSNNYLSSDHDQERSETGLLREQHQYNQQEENIPLSTRDVDPENGTNIR